MRAFSRMPSVKEDPDSDEGNDMNARDKDGFASLVCAEQLDDQPSWA